jgi:hypothetical protein
MSLVDVLDAIAERISAAVDSNVHVGDSTPVDENDLPALTLTADEITERLTGIGGIPSGTRTGALAVVVEVDLANPVADFGNDQTIPLLSADRRTLTLPNGPLVRADGVGENPFTAEDLRVEDSQPYDVVDATPTGRQVRPDPANSTLTFGSPLPPTGILTVDHYLGQWDEVVSRYQGILVVAMVSTTGDSVRALSRQVADALRTPHPIGRFAPRSWGALHAQQIGGSDAIGRTVGYRFDAELVEPILPAGGGVIVTIAAAAHTDTAVEHFTIGREGGPA